MNAFDSLHKQAKEAEEKWEKIDKLVSSLKKAFRDNKPQSTESLLKNMGEVIILLSEVQRPTNVGGAIEDLEESLKGLQGIMGSLGKSK